MKKKACTKNCPANCLANPNNHIPHEHLMMAVSAFILALVGVINATNSVNAAMVSSAQKKNISCYDNDPLARANFSGIVTSVNFNQNGKMIVERQADLCLNDKALKEFYCDKNGRISSKIVLCNKTTTCEKGACKVPTPISQTSPIVTPVTTTFTTPTNSTTSITPTVASTTSTSPTVSSTPKKNGTVTISADFPLSTTIQTITRGTIIGRFKITNNSSSKIRVTDMKLDDLGVHSPDLSYRLFFSDQNSPNYTGNIAITEKTNINFTNLDITIEGGGYRYFSVALVADTGLSAGDYFMLGADSYGDVLFSVEESDLGYDGNINGTISDTITGINIGGGPILGQIIKR